MVFHKCIAANSHYYPPVALIENFNFLKTKLKKMKYKKWYKCDKNVKLKI